MTLTQAIDAVLAPLMDDIVGSYAEWERRAAAL